MGCSVKLSCMVSFKGATVLPAVTVTRQSRVAWGTLTFNFLIPVQFKKPLKTTFFFFFNGIFYLESK